MTLCPVFQRYILKAIHNSPDDVWIWFSVVSGISKIHSESNSQLLTWWVRGIYGCVRYFKDTFWKQFTTWQLRHSIRHTLCPVFQRYILKAIHNWPSSGPWGSTVVSGISKIHSESNSQPVNSNDQILLSCVRYFKDTFWKQFTTMGMFCKNFSRLCPVFQRYILKAIHNNTEMIPMNTWVVSGISKIHSESNSQLSIKSSPENSSCVRYFKDTFWKQFTTTGWAWPLPTGLCPVFQRYILKAIHNYDPSGTYNFEVVSGISKIHSESNSQLLVQCL